MQTKTLLAALLFAGASMTARAADAPDAELDHLRTLNAHFAPVDLVVNLDAVPANEKQALAKLVEASRTIDSLFQRQVWAGNADMLRALAQDDSPVGRERLAFFLSQQGPWDRQDEFRPVIAGAPAKPPQGTFYPADATKDEIAKWLDSLSGDDKEHATGFFTTIRRDRNGGLVAIPYSVEYQPELQAVAARLREAADLTKQPTLKDFLTKRAAALLSNDYYDSDVSWMKLDATIEPTIGPYEVYEDEWFNYKASFESFIALKDLQESANLQKYSTQLQDLENNLPEDPKFRVKKIGALAPITVVNEIFCSGNANMGVQTAAYNLPNDDHVTAKYGSKRVMLKNVQQAKFDKILVPIAKIALAPAEQSKVSFEPFFTEILMHELMHGLGPHEIEIAGRKTTPREELKEQYSAIEEAKADITGLWAIQHLIDKKVIDKSMEKTIYTTYLAGCFRAIRFGLVEAHGRGEMMQLNRFLDDGAVVVAADGTFRVDDKKIAKSVAALDHDLLTIEATGDYAGAKALMDKGTRSRPEITAVLKKLESLPIDIAPRFVTADQLTGVAQPRM